MRTRSITLLFILVAILLGAGFWASKKIIRTNENTTTRAKIVTPKSSHNTENEADAEKLNSGFNSEMLDTFITLKTASSV